ncbi:pentatricopeptide repeat domain 1 L homeolog isoform X1 [Xenopus laevis]|uniref:LOC495833 protein n=2 Tax=Xenopus laevis TaxID=8355 RepID=Q5RJW9_XENLA|nr:pentatricopeptide repeat domain 1 L homeolog [Xenopus laevis]XP_041431654.1 pentatricopeptide repeat domain 1 L homeolog isoform X1 [Xenopus laevis]AAH86472.1 LOC495833 protein [Xenopus laevis]OCT63969.1 hypothetical protein XELAEV_18045065mg [Xenopus laevis]
MRLLQHLARYLYPRSVCQTQPVCRKILASKDLDNSIYWFGSMQCQRYCNSSVSQRHISNSQRTYVISRENDNTNPGVDNMEEEAFGTVTGKYSSRAFFKKTSPELQTLAHEDDEEGPKYPIRRRQRNTPYWYFLKCKAKIKQDKLAEALQLFEVNMLQEERLQPDESNYTVLIGGCGRAGYVKKAFSLYSDMKKRGLVPTDPTYTALFNACAESPWKESGLQQALKLRQELKSKSIQLNLVTYQSLLKVFALCSDLQNSMEIFKEIVQEGHIITKDTFNILLMSCIKNKEIGFRYSLQVWRQMIRLGIKPDNSTYNLLLRATRDCGIGDPAEASALLLSSKEPAPRMLKAKTGKHIKGMKKKMNATSELDVEMLEKQLFIGESTQLGISNSKGMDNLCLQENAKEINTIPQPARNQEICDALILPSSTSLHLPNLLDGPANTDIVVSLGSVSTPTNRLALIGGMEGIIQKMHNDKVSPTIKTFTLLAEIIEPDDKIESNLLNTMDSAKVKADVTFFNTLLRKRSKLINLHSAKELLPIFAQRGIAPNIQTFCGLAISCHKKDDGLQLLEDMTISGVIPNTYIYSTLISAAVKRLDYAYLLDILRDMKKRNVPPNEVIIHQLEFASQYPPTYDKYKSKNVFLEKIDGFRGYYNRWLNWMTAQQTPHPWEKYKSKTKSKDNASKIREDE